MKNTLVLSGLFLLLGAGQALADSGNQVFYRYGKDYLGTGRGGQVFTDTNGAGGFNNGDKNGTSIGAGLDLTMIRNLGPGSVVGEISATYTKYSQHTVRQTTSALLSGSANSNVTVSELEWGVSPKYRFENWLGGKFRPWIIPLGLSFMVNSPPSNDSTYLDIGLNVGAGAEYMILSELSLGLDVRHTFDMKDTNVDMSHTTVGLYAGVNF